MASLIKRKIKSVDNILFEDPESKLLMISLLLGYPLESFKYSEDRIEGLFRMIFEYSKFPEGIAHIRLNRLYEYFTVDHFNIFLGSFLSNFPFIHTIYLNKAISKNTNLVMEGIKDIEAPELTLLEYEDIDGNFKNNNALMTLLFKDIKKDLGTKKIKFANGHIWNFRVKEYGNDIPDIQNHFNIPFPGSTNIYSYINFPPKNGLEYNKIVNFLLLRGKSKEVIMALLINQMDIYKWAEENIINEDLIGDGSVVYVDKIIGMSTIKDIKYDEVYIYKIPKDKKFIGEDDKNTLCISDPNDTQNKYKVYIKFQCVS